MYVSCGCDEESAESGEASLEGWPEPPAEFILDLIMHKPKGRNVLMRVTEEMCSGSSALMEV